MTQVAPAPQSMDEDALTAKLLQTAAEEMAEAEKLDAQGLGQAQALFNMALDDTQPTIEVLGRRFPVLGLDPKAQPELTAKWAAQVEANVRLVQDILKRSEGGTPRKVDNPFTVAVKYSLFEAFTHYFLWEVVSGHTKTVRDPSDNRPKTFYVTDDAKWLVMEMTKKLKCRFIELPGIPDDMLGPPTHFVSHRWGAAWAEFSAQLAYERAYRKAANESEAFMKAEEKDGRVHDVYSEDEFYWVDILSLNQHNETNPGALAGLLPQCLVKCRMALICMDTDALLFKGLWCMYEMAIFGQFQNGMGDCLKDSLWCCVLMCTCFLLQSCDCINRKFGARTDRQFGRGTILQPLPLELSMRKSPVKLGTQDDLKAIAQRYRSVMYNFDMQKVVEDETSKNAADKDTQDPDPAQVQARAVNRQLLRYFGYSSLDELYNYINVNTTVRGAIQSFVGRLHWTARSDGELIRPFSKPIDVELSMRHHKMPVDKELEKKVFANVNAVNDMSLGDAVRDITSRDPGKIV